MIRGVSAAKRAPPWQDLRAMHSRKAVCGAFRIHGAHILPMPARFGCMAAICCQGGALFPSEAPSGMHEAKNLPRQGVRERIGAISRHGWPPGNASRENIATDGRPWTHHGEISPPSDVGGRNSRASCHRRALGDASRRNIATADNAPKTNEGERFARLRSLFSFTTRVAQGLRSDKPPTFGIPLGWGFRVRRNCASRPIC